MKRNNEKGSILLMSSVLLAVVTIIGSMIVIVFFRGYVDVAKDINYQKERISIQVEAQEIYSTLDISVELPEGISYDEIEEVYSYSCSNEVFIIDVLLNKDLKIIKWQIKEI